MIVDWVEVFQQLQDIAEYYRKEGSEEQAKEFEAAAATIDKLI